MAEGKAGDGGGHPRFCIWIDAFDLWEIVLTSKYQNFAKIGW